MTREKIERALDWTLRDRAHMFVTYPDALPPEAMERIFAVGDDRASVLDAMEREIKEMERGLEPKHKWPLAS